MLRQSNISIVVEMASCGVFVCWLMIAVVAATEVNQCPGELYYYYLKAFNTK